MKEHDGRDEDRYPPRRTGALRETDPSEAPDPQQERSRPRARPGSQVASRSAHSPALQVQVKFAPALPIIRLHGHLDQATVHLLQDAIGAVTDTNGRGNLVVLDLRELDFCDAPGLDAINQARLQMAEIGKELVLRDTPDIVRKLLNSTGLEQEFNSI
jgi:anti-anti-sigma factor